MLEPTQRTPKHVLRQVTGWVLVLPLLVSFLSLPFPFGGVLALGSIAASVHGTRFARRCASRGVAMFALIITLLNVISLVGISEASLLKGLYRISWLYGYPYYSNWVYSNL
ncbi:hypothetical protein I7860_06295 [Pseudomonas tolaasii]|uniref:hypothetical protein n=1 Tax=Pseudomonas tolaasii TaxID=29442 RepID=UPI001C565A35|nr:hypothetical protein [Pseudomonas tolaasii]MBW1246289.1 hypothetical protein [Pseudomonas tolaasii]